MNIRNLKPQDKNIFLEMCTDFYSGDATLFPISNKNMLDTFDYIINDSTFVKGYIFEVDSFVAGYALVCPYYSNEAGGVCLLLDEIYVSPKFQGNGIGTKFLNEIEKLVKLPIKALRLEVTDDNQRAIKLYEKSGFKTLDYKQLLKFNK